MPKAATRGGLAIAVAAYAGWLGHLALEGEPGCLRAALACVALGLLCRRRLDQGGSGGRTNLAMLAGCAVPIERYLDSFADLRLQRFTAHCAGLLVNATGLPVTLLRDPVPTLAGPQNLLVHVTSMCAGSGTFLALFTLGLVLAEMLFKQPGERLFFVLLAPLFGFVGNVLRVALSTHAANRWAGAGGLLWPIAHDVIGYATFCATYLGLFGCIELMRRQTAKVPTARPAARDGA